jgi:hypothetical protein
MKKFTTLMWYVNFVFLIIVFFFKDYLPLSISNITGFIAPGLLITVLILELIIWIKNEK